MSAMENDFITELAQFRQDHLSPDVLLDWLTSRPRRKGFLDLGAGYGKSRAMKILICTPALYDCFDRVVCVVDQRRVLSEYLSMLDEHFPADLRDGLVILQARPRERCGDLDPEWHDLEHHSCGAMARATLCHRCPHRETCDWLVQGDPERLQKAKLIVGVQDFLRLIPDLLKELPDGRTTLLIIDEWRDITRPLKTVMTVSSLRTLEGTCLQLLQASGSVEEHHPFLEAVRHFLDHLICRRPLKHLPGLPAIDPSTMAWWQQEGHRLGREAFVNILPDLFGLKRCRNRWYTKRGDVAFMAYLPVHPHAMLITSTGTPIGLLRDKLDCPDIEPVITATPPVHPDTCIYNIRYKAGSRRNFPQNMSRILDFFSALTARELAAGRKVLLVSVKQFLEKCRKEMEVRLANLMGTAIPVHTDTDNALPDHCRVGIIHYGVSGSNAYKAFDSTFCLNSYYTPTDVLSAALSDIIPGDHSYPVSIDYIDGNRVATCDSASPRIRELAGELHWLHEGLVVTQAIGRVRYNTHPRIVITMQTSGSRITMSREFTCLEEARTFFNITDRRTTTQLRRSDLIDQLRRDGHIQREVAETLKVSLSTVKRGWKRCHEV